MHRLSVSVQEDHLQTLARSPLQGLAELIWNSLDADADDIEVMYERNALDGIEAVRVVDDGHGMTPADIDEVFGQLGGSWKRLADKTKTKGRSLHGRSGQGRWRAFGIGGARVVWETVADADGRRLLTRIEIDREDLRNATVSEPEESGHAAGTVASVEGISEAPAGLLAAETPTNLATRFALHLAKYPDVHITVDGNRVDPSEAWENIFDRFIEADDQHEPAVLTIIEWKRDVDRRLYLCDEQGVALHELPAAVAAPGFQYTAYLKSPLFRELESDLPLADLGHETLSGLVAAGREELRKHFEERLATRAGDVIKDWQAEEVYPFLEPPRDDVEAVKRQLFDVVAYTASPAVNATKDKRAKRLSLRLLQETMESEPTALRRILEEVLRLPKEQIEQLDELLQHTTLTSIVTASRKIADRLEFLRGLEYLLFDPEMKEALKERSQLHKIVRNEPWIFGEHYALAVDDRSLNEVLKAHLADLGSEIAADDAPVLDAYGKPRIIDLMFAGSMAQPKNRREHLVVELKRPSVKIGSAELTQIERYAFAVADDARFNTNEVEWDFWVVSDDLDSHARERANQDGQPEGLIHKSRSGRVRVWAVQWGKLIEDARHRLKFVQEQLNYLVTDEAAVLYLRRAHEKFLPPNLMSSDQS
jgi:hypothetical protein